MKNFLFVMILTITFQALLGIDCVFAGTSIFEAEVEANNFTAKVKVIRQNHGETEVAFESDKHLGFYILPESDKKGELSELLEKSRKPKGPDVIVSVDSNRQITSVTLKETSKDKEQ